MEANTGIATDSARRHHESRAPLIKNIRPVAPPAPHAAWLNLDQDVAVEATSEDPEWPIEQALLLDRTGGWRAAGPGPQTISLEWPVPISIRHIRLVFEELSQARTQEFVLRASTNDGDRDVVRQQFTFAPPGTTVEREEYATELKGVTRLELAIVPAIDRSPAIATLKEWRISSAPIRDRV
jgi:hypothetical protein